ncbi:MAG: phosphoglucosamine mutase [Tissierellia bacterium]|nr:phosphoglucosamine mutase [Tissierellia bacterium]
MGRLFGTDGVRGVANDELTATMAFKLGRTAAKVLGKMKPGLILVGRDTRISGQMLESALKAGICSMGIDVGELGILPTPAVAYLTRHYKALCGIVISASHNPGEYNGIKFFNGEGNKLSDEVEDEIEAHMDECLDWEGPTGKNIGICKDFSDGSNIYENFLVDTIPVDLKGLKIALDCGHGALYNIAPNVIKKLGGEVIAINTKPDGMNINDNCGSTNPQMISELVRSSNADIGMSFDGDGDRIIAVDEVGNVIDGDHILAISALWLKNNAKLSNDIVVGTVMSNLGLKKYLESIGVELIMAPVGDRYVLEDMQRLGASIGGEQSGHIIFLDYNTTGDGLATGLHLTEISVKMGRALSELNQLMVNYPQVLVNAKVANSMKYYYEEEAVIKDAILKIEETFDGEGRVVIRPSGTEPLVRVMIEGKDQSNITEHATALANLIEERMNEN